jgi:hypothetical protein
MPVGGPTPPPGWEPQPTAQLPAPKKSRTPLFVGLGVVAALAVGGAIVAARGGDDDQLADDPSATAVPLDTDAPEATDDAPVDTGEPDATDPDSPTTQTAPADSEPSGGGGGGDPANPLPVSSPFSYEDPFIDAAWEGIVFGLVEVPKAEFSDPGRCLVVVGSIAPTKIDGGVSTGFFAPTVSIIADGVLQDSTFAECDTSGLEAQGYRWSLNAQVTPGTDFPFFNEFYFAGDTIPTVDSIVVGDPTGDGAFYFQPTVLPAAPAPPLTNVGALAQPIQPVGAFQYEDPFGSSAWDGVVHGLVEIPIGQFATGGRCVAVVGTLTPTKAEGAVTNSFDAPSMALVSNGRLVDGTFAECDTTGLEAAGYQWILDAEVTVGTSYPFFAEFYFPADSLPPLEAIAAGDPTSTNAIYFEPTIQPAAPSP